MILLGLKGKNKVRNAREKKIYFWWGCLRFDCGEKEGTSRLEISSPIGGRGESVRGP